MSLLLVIETFEIGSRKHLPNGVASEGVSEDPVEIGGDKVNGQRTGNEARYGGLTESRSFAAPPDVPVAHPIVKMGICKN